MEKRGPAMAAVPPAGRELCPHCHRPFKRLRAHLPHCKAAPSPAPGTAPGTGPNSGPGPGPAATSAPGPLPGLGPSPGPAGKSNKHPPGAGQGLPGGAPREPAAARKGKKAATEKGGGGTGSGLRRQPEGRRAEQEVEPAVRDVAKCLDLLPEEVEDLPAKLSNGVKIVIEKHRARVIREKGRSGSAPAGSRSTLRPPAEGPDPGGASDAAQPDPREGRAVPAAANTETRGLGAAEPASASSEREKGGSLKARKTPMLGDPPEADSRSSPTDLAEEAARGKNVTEEEQMYLEAGVEYKAPLSALHTEILHLSAIEGFGGHKEGTSKSDLTSTQKLREREQQMATISEPILNARRDTELALPLSLLQTSKNQPICLSQAPGRSTAAGATGMEWFPDLHPNYHGLSIFTGKPFHENEGITIKTPKGSFSEGHQGPLLERRLMDVRLGELPTWLVTCDFSPQGLLGGVQKAWSSYYNKYINVKRGGPAGISMLLAGYCLLSYGWSYQHIKLHRWRKYH